MSNEYYIKPRNKVIRWYDKLSYTWQLIAEANYMDKRVKAREERSKISYEKIILELCYWYCWDAEVDERINKRYQRYRKIADKNWF